MKILFKAISVLLFQVVVARADTHAIARLYEQMIATSAVGDAGLPRPEDLLLEVNENSVRSLPIADAQDLVPIGIKCLRLKSDKIRRNGMLLMLAIALRSDSAVLIDPHAEYFESIASNPQDVLKDGAFYVLENMKPALSAKVRGFLVARLMAGADSPRQRLPMADALLRSPGDQATIDTVVTFADHEADIGVKAGILMQLGRIQTPDNHVLEFIGSSLDNTNPSVRRGAIEATRNLPYALRMQFIDKLRAIAEDSRGNAEIRAGAAAVLKQPQ